MRIISELLKLSSSLFGGNGIYERCIVGDGEENGELHVQIVWQVGGGQF